MALKVIHPVVFDQLDVDPAWATAIKEGMVVRAVQNGDKTYVGLSTTTSSIGLAGDNLSTTGGSGAYKADLVISAKGPVSDPTVTTRSTQNRVQDMFNETSGSGSMTVYHSGGTFATDQYDTNTVYSAGDALGAGNDGKVTRLSTLAGSPRRIGQVLIAPKAISSGVPGTDTDDNSLSLGNFLTFKLEI